jgi:hypothetical protein
VALHLPLAPPFWKVLMGDQVTFADLADLDESEHASLRALLDAPLEEGTIFETFELALGPHRPAAAGGGPGGGGTVRLVPAGPHKKVRAAWGKHGGAAPKQRGPQNAP